MEKPTTEALQAARQPLASLLHKSQKAKQKVVPGSWQFTMLQSNIAAIRIALSLLDTATPDAGTFTQTNLQEALRTFAALADKASQAQAKFAPGTSQHSLQQNRLRALRVATAQIQMALHARAAMPDRRA